MFLLSKTSRPPLRPTQPHFPWLPEFFLGGNAAGKYIRSPASSANVMNKWSYASTPPYAFMAWTRKTFLLVPHTLSCTFVRVRRLWHMAECWISTQQTASTADKNPPQFRRFFMALAVRRHITPSLHILRAMRENNLSCAYGPLLVYLPKYMIFTILAFEKKVFLRTFGQMQ